MPSDREPGENPAPGSDAAIAAGCTCPVGANCRGRGWMGMAGVYWMTVGCPLHGERSPSAPLTAPAVGGVEGSGGEAKGEGES